MLYFVFSLHDTCYMSDAARSVIVSYDFHYYCCDNKQYRNIAVINQIKEGGADIKYVS